MTSTRGHALWQGRNGACWPVLAVLGTILLVAALALGSTAGTVAAADKDVDRSDLEGAIYFSGQNLSVSGFDPGERVALRSGDHEDSTWVEYIRANADGEVHLSTAELDGQYVLRAEDGAMYGPFEVTEQTVSFAFATDSVNAGETTELEFVDDNRLETVDLLISADGALSGGELASIFEGATVEDDETVRISDATEGDTFVADFTAVSPANYSFTVSVADSNASDAADITVGEAVTEQTSFDADDYSGTEGDVVEFTVEHQATDESWVTVQEADGNFDLTFDMVDPERDSVRIRFNTWHASDDPAGFEDAFSSPDADLEFVTASASFDHDAGQRLLHAPIELETGPDTGDRETPTDAAILSLEPRETEGITTHVAPSHQLDRDDGLADITALSAERETLASGDLLVVEVDATGVFGYIDDESVSASEAGLDITLTQREDPRYSAPFEQSLLESSTDATIHTDPANESLYVVVDEADLDGTEPGMTLDAAFEVSEDNPYSDSEETVTTSFEIVERSIELVGSTDQTGRLEIPAVSEAPIRAETTVAPGTRLQYSVRLPYSRHTKSAPVEGDASVAYFDTSEYSGGTEVEAITVRDPVTGNRTSKTGVLVDENQAAFEVETTAPSTVGVNEEATLNVSVTNTGTETGVATLEVVIDGTVVETRTFTLAPSARWTKNYSIDTAEPGELTWEVRSPSQRNDSVQIVNSSADGADSAEDDGSAGFGVAVSLVALLSAAMLALRRRT